MKHGRAVCLVTIAALLVSCAFRSDPEEEERLLEPTQEESASDPGAWDKVRGTYQKAKDAGQEDLDKVGDWEYLVAEIDPEDTVSLQESLNQHGVERWNLVWMHTTEEKTTFIFKRPVSSYLQHVPVTEMFKMLFPLVSE